IRRSVPGAIHDQELVLEEERLRNYGTGAARSEQAGQGSDEVDEKNDQIAHHRIVAGRGILRNPEESWEITIRQPHLAALDHRFREGQSCEPKPSASSLPA